MASGAPERLTPAKAAVSVLLSAAFFAVPLFGAATTLDWWRAWVVVAVDVGCASIALVDLARVSPGLLEERMRPPFSPGQPLADRVLQPLLVLVFVGSEIVTALDVFHLHLLPRPSEAVAWSGLGLFAAGWAIMYAAMRQNAFASAMVRYQPERAQRVIDTGLYGLVRHPMYAGAIPFLFGMPLWLQSYAGALVVLLVIPIGALRIRSEERLLLRELPGYAQYAARVRYRLVPFVL